jgi:hypothetical protein
MSPSFLKTLQKAPRVTWQTPIRYSITYQNLTIMSLATDATYASNLECMLAVTVQTQNPSRNPTKKL